MAFFRLWFGIIIFGMASGFILMPVLLSLVGPLNTDVPHEEESGRVSPEMSQEDKLEKGVKQVEEVEPEVAEEGNGVKAV